MSNRVNVGRLGRWMISQALGTVRGRQVIDALESGLWEALDALRRRDFAGFWNALPPDWQAWILAEARKKIGGLL